MLTLHACSAACEGNQWRPSTHIFSLIIIPFRSNFIASNENYSSSNKMCSALVQEFKKMIIMLEKFSRTSITTVQNLSGCRLFMNEERTYRTNFYQELRYFKRTVISSSVRYERTGRPFTKMTMYRNLGLTVVVPFRPTCHEILNNNHWHRIIEGISFLCIQKGNNSCSFHIIMLRYGVFNFVDGFHRC